DAERVARVGALGAAWTFMMLARLLGLFIEKPRGEELDSKGDAAGLLDLIIEVRKMSRDAKQFQIADRIRDRLTELGFTLEDGQDGTRWRRA
ncbi:MAG: hypothetical protein B6D36_16560, partial [Planctomycetes bacterium UTPLA1]